MRVALCIALVMSVLNAVQGQTTPTTTPEDYRLTFRNPDGCAPSECEFFAGIQTNEGDPTFLDFYLEGSAQGWVAIGVSETQNMFSADVLGCNVLQGSAMVVAVDTWNLDIPVRFNQLDSTQDGLILHNSSFLGGRITCSFSRSVAAMDPGQDLDLNGDYFVIYGTANTPAPSASSGLAFHDRTPTLSSQRINLVTGADSASTSDPTPDPTPDPTRDPTSDPIPDLTPPLTTTPEDYRLTFRNPSGCAPSECEFFAGIQTNEGDPTFLDFYLEGNGQGWVAIGISETQNMFSADVLGCNVLQGSAMVVAVDTWNLDIPVRFNQLDSTQDGLVQHNSSFVGGRITCSFSRSISAMDAGQDLNLNGDYFVLYGISNNPAPNAASGLAPHAFLPQSFPSVSGQTMNLVTDPDSARRVLEFVPPVPPTRAPEDSRMIVSNPGGCNRPTCDLFIGISTNEDNSSFFDFYIEGEAAGWVAIGFSETQNMFSADVLGCSVISGTTTVEVVDTWNVPNARLNTIDNTQEGLYPHSTSNVNGRISCSFSRFTGIVNSGQDVDLANGEYFILFGVGENPAFVAGSALSTHRPQSNPALTGRINVAQALLGLSVAPVQPTTSPEDYRLTFRNPSGCAPSECEFFAGIQTNEGDSTFLDFYLEGNGQGWVAIGVSETQSMFSADVLGCNVFQGSAMVVAVDTWNLDVPSRFNTIDSTQDGLVQHNSSFVGGRITCSFSRSISAMDPGQDLDLNGDYFVMYGTADTPAPSASSGLAFHGTGVGRVPRLSSQTINLATNADPTSPPTPEDCPNPVECLVDPCRDAECLRFPTARCVPDFCQGECRATFVRGQRNNDVTARCGNRTACQIKECPSRRICVEELMPPVCPDDMPDCTQATRARCVLPPRPTSCEEVMCEEGMVCRFRARSGRRPVIRCVPAPLTL